MRLVLATTALVALLVLAGFGVASLVSRSSSDAKDTTLTLNSAQFVTLVQVCAAVQNGRLPFRPATPIATPPLPSQETLDGLLQNCGQR